MTEPSTWMTGPSRPPKKLAEQRATHCRDGSSGAPCPTQVVSWFQSAFNQLTKWIASEICRGWEVWDPNLKKTTLSYPWRYPLYNVTVRLSETAHASDFPSAAIQQLCTASSASSASSCPVIGRPNPKTIIPSKAPEEAGREMGRPHVEQTWTDRV